MYNKQYKLNTYVVTYLLGAVFLRNEFVQNVEKWANESCILQLLYNYVINEKEESVFVIDMKEKALKSNILFDLVLLVN